MTVEAQDEMFSKLMTQSLPPLKGKEPLPQQSPPTRGPAIDLKKVWKGVEVQRSGEARQTPHKSGSNITAAILRSCASSARQTHLGCIELPLLDALHGIEVDG